MALITVDVKNAELAFSIFGFVARSHRHDDQNVNQLNCKNADLALSTTGSAGVLIVTIARNMNALKEPTWDKTEAHNFKRNHEVFSRRLKTDAKRA